MHSGLETLPAADHVEGRRVTRGGLSLVWKDSHPEQGVLSFRLRRVNKSRHPLPASEESRHDRIPESIEREKGDGDDTVEPFAPEQKSAPDGEPYPAAPGDKS